MEKYIFLYGDEQEVYNREERKFIEGVGNIFIYREFHKKTKRGTMPCRVIAAEIETIEPIKSSVFFMKEIKLLEDIQFSLLKRIVNFILE